MQPAKRLHAVPPLPDDDRTVVAPPTFTLLDEDEKTRVDSRRIASAVSSVVRLAQEDEPTRVGPSPLSAVLHHEEATGVGPLLVPAPLHHDEPTRVGPPPVLPAPAGHDLKTMPELAPAEMPTGKTNRRPPLVRKNVLVAGAVVLVMSACALGLARKRAASTPVARPPVAATVAVAPKAAPLPVAPPVTSTAGAPSPAAARATPSSSAAGAAVTSASQAPAPRVPAPAPVAAVTSSPREPSLPAAPASAPSDERAAVEAVAAGSYTQAARLYRGLAATHPSDEAYREAARILLERSKENPR